MLLQSFLTLLTFWITLGTADVSISKPIKGQTYTVDDSSDSVTVPIVWVESSSDPTLDEIKTYSFTICTGPNSDINGIKTLEKVSASDITDYSYDLEIPSSIGSDGTYFVQIYAAVESSGYSIHYTYRFTLSGMTGTLETSGSDTNPPSAEVNLETSTDTATYDTSASFSVFYTSQTGKTRYAPMQTQPGSTVTATTWSRKFSTSAVTYYSTIRASLAQVSTITPGWSYTLSSAVNWASAAAQPSENGGWYDPSARLQSATLTKLSGSSSSTATSSS